MLEIQCYFTKNDEYCNDVRELIKEFENNHQLIITSTNGNFFKFKIREFTKLLKADLTNFPGVIAARLSSGIS